MPTFYVFFNEHIEKTKEANAILSGEVDASPEEVRKAKYTIQVEAPYEREVAAQAFGLMFDNQQEALDYIGGKIENMTPEARKNHYAAIFADIQKKAAEAAAEHRRRMQEARELPKQIRKKLIKKGVGNVIKAVAKVETKVEEVISDATDQIEKLASKELPETTQTPEEKNMFEEELSHVVFKDLEQDIDKEKTEAVEKLLEEKLSKKAEADFLLEQSLKKEEDCPAKEAINNVSIGGLYNAIQKYTFRPESEEFKAINDKAKLLSEKAMEMENKATPSAQDWIDYNFYLKEVRVAGEEFIANKDMELANNPDEARSPKDHASVVAVTRVLNRVKQEEALSDQAKKIMNGCEHAIKILKSGKYDNIYPQNPEDVALIEEKIKLIAHASMGRDLRADGYADEMVMNKTNRDELTNDVVFRTVASKFDGSKIAEAIEEKMFPEILKAARASFEARKEAEAKKNGEANENAEAIKDTEAKNEEAKPKEEKHEQDPVLNGPV